MIGFCLDDLTILEHPAIWRIEYLKIYRRYKNDNFVKRLKRIRQHPFLIRTPLK